MFGREKITIIKDPAQDRKKVLKIMEELGVAERGDGKENESLVFWAPIYLQVDGDFLMVRIYGRGEENLNKLETVVERLGEVPNLKVVGERLDLDKREICLATDRREGEIVYRKKGGL